MSKWAGEHLHTPRRARGPAPRLYSAFCVLFPEVLQSRSRAWNGPQGFNEGAVLAGVSTGATGSYLGGCPRELLQSLQIRGRRETRTHALGLQVCSWECGGDRCRRTLGLEANFCYFVLSARAVLSLLSVLTALLGGRSSCRAVCREAESSKLSGNSLRLDGVFTVAHWMVLGVGVGGLQLEYSCFLKT